MMTVHEVCKISGVSARTLHHYDAIGLLKPCKVTDAGYRLYDEACLERLGQIMLFRELEFSLAEIKKILDHPDFDRRQALEQQTELLKLKKERLEALIAFAENLKRTGENKMDFNIFDKTKIDRYAQEAKKKWGDTSAYREYREKTAELTEEKQKTLAEEMMEIFAEFGAIKDRTPSDPSALMLVQKLRDFITANYYTCTKQILAGLGQLYKAGGEMTENIDAAGGKGTAEFTANAIAEYCAEG